MAKILKDDELDLPQIDWFLTVLTALCLAIIHNFAVLAYRHQKIIAAEKMDEYVRRQAEQGVHRSTWYLEFELGHHLNEKKKELQTKNKTEKKKEKGKKESGGHLVRAVSAAATPTSPAAIVEE